MTGHGSSAPNECTAEGPFGYMDSTLSTLKKNCSTPLLFLSQLLGLTDVLVSFLSSPPSTVARPRYTRSNTLRTASEGFTHFMYYTNVISAPSVSLFIKKPIRNQYPRPPELIRFTTLAS